MLKSQKVFYVVWCILFLIYFLVLIFFQPYITNKCESNYAEYYAQAKNNTQLEKSQNKTKCTKAVDVIDTDKMQIVNTIYSFSYEDVFNFDEVYYDSDTKYTEGCTYDCTIYTFYCVSNETFASYKFLVVGNGNTSKSGQVFNLENKSSECIDSFAKEILSNNIDNISGKCTCLLIFTGIIIIVLFFVIPIYLEIRNKKNRYKLHFFKSNK